MKAGAGKNLEVRPEGPGQGAEEPTGTDGKLVCSDATRGVDLHFHSLIQLTIVHRPPSVYKSPCQAHNVYERRPPPRNSQFRKWF